MLAKWHETVFHCIVRSTCRHFINEFLILRDDAFEYQIPLNADGWQNPTLEFQKLPNSIFVLDRPLTVHNHLLDICGQGRNGFHHVSTGGTLHTVQGQHIYMNYICHELHPPFSGLLPGLGILGVVLIIPFLRFNGLIHMFHRNIVRHVSPRGKCIAYMAACGEAYNGIFSRGEQA